MYRGLDSVWSTSQAALSSTQPALQTIKSLILRSWSSGTLMYVACIAFSGLVSFAAGLYLFQSNMAIFHAFSPGVTIAPYFDFNLQQSMAVGTTLFFMLAGCGVLTLRYHLHHMEVRAAATKELQENNRRFRGALDNMGEGLCMFDEHNRLVVYNDRYADWYRLPEKLLKLGTPHTDIISHRVSKGILAGSVDDDAVDHKVMMLSQMEVEKPTQRVDHLADGRVISVSRQPLEGGGFVATHKDISEQFHSSAKIAHMAHHDALTGLPNRLLFQERLSDALDRVRRGESVAVHCLDLDHFKNVNDTLGHPVGDRLLTVVAERLQNEVRDIDTVARLGGDEFAIVQTQTESPEDVTAFASRIVETLSAPFNLGDHQVVIGASVGIALAPNDGENVEQLMKNADLALYRVKSEGRGSYCFFEQAMDDRMQERRILELDLRKALVCNEFDIYYQPLVNLEANSVCGFEALIRWQHPERGLVSPGEFIPLAEEIGLIGQLGSWVLHRACADAVAWPDDIKIAVNLSALQFKDGNLVEEVASVLEATGMPARRLELEITESVLMEDSQATIEILHQLRKLGVRISMDDFGTGYSSLSYLQSFPFDKIKIDRSFVARLSERHDALAIVRAVAALSANLGMATTAEGVETEEQLEMIRLEGCTEVQGYLFSSARPIEEVSDLIQSLTPRVAEVQTAA